MTPALRAFLAGIVDYAGLFPPARLPLEPAIRNYVRYSRGDDAWMLGRFVIPAARLADLDPLAEELFQSGVPVLFSALGRGGGTTAELIAATTADLDEINRFRQAHGAGVLVDAFEVKLPADAVGDGLPALLDNIVPTLVQAGRLAVYLELPPGADRAVIIAATSAVAGRRGVGLKLRCGGLTAADFPSVDHVAMVLNECAERDVPLKATAGLHHPLPRFDETIGARMHGFLNVFAAGMLASECGASEEAVAEALSDEDPAAFNFGDGLRWREWTIDVPHIAAARRDAVVSFGSCSFDEPRDDLRALGWL
jgi:hypothetical protein